MNKYIMALFVFMIISAWNGITDYKKMEIMGPSMEPTFKDGQIVKVDTDYYNQHEVERNELVCFYMGEKNKKYIKRVVGLPNEKIKVMEDKILINDVPIDLPVKMVDNSRVGEYETGADDFFVIGDNYNDSLDSRMIGTIKQEQIVGKVIE